MDPALGDPLAAGLDPDVGRPDDARRTTGLGGRGDDGKLEVRLGRQPVGRVRRKDNGPGQAGKHIRALADRADALDLRRAVQPDQRRLRAPGVARDLLARPAA